MRAHHPPPHVLTRGHDSSGPRRHPAAHHLRNAFAVLGTTLTALAVGFAVALVLINWMTGCGETFAHPGTGATTPGACVTPMDLLEGDEAND